MPPYQWLLRTPAEFAYLSIAHRCFASLPNRLMLIRFFMVKLTPLRLERVYCDFQLWCCGPLVDATSSMVELGAEGFRKNFIYYSLQQWSFPMQYGEYIVANGYMIIPLLTFERVNAPTKTRIIVIEDYNRLVTPTACYVMPSPETAPAPWRSCGNFETCFPGELLVYGVW